MDKDVKRNEGLLGRWSRLKRKATEANQAVPDSRHDDTDETASPREAGGIAPAVDTTDDNEAGRVNQTLPDLPSIDELGPDSNFEAFMDPAVDDDVRRAALKALFRDPDFNVTDGLDVYAEDYSKLEKLTPAMVAALRYAQRTLFGGDDRRQDQHGQDDVARTTGTDRVAVATEAHEEGQSAGVSGESGSDGTKQQHVKATQAQPGQRPTDPPDTQTGNS